MMFCSVSTYEKWADMDMKEFIRNYREYITYIDKYDKSIRLDNGNVIIFMGEERYRKWCKGRDYVKGGWLMHSDFEVKIWDGGVYG